VILTILHTGNWEVAGARLARAGLRIHAVAGTQLRRQWTEELRRRQEACGIRILPPGRASWREMPRILARNEILALLVDGNLFRRGTWVDLGRHRVEFPSGPAHLAASTGAALLPVFSLRLKSGGLSAEFLEEIRLQGADRDAIRDATRLLAGCFTRGLRAHPEQWMIFRPFFAPGSSARVSLSTEEAF
jgi:KDO2-lipid IV(A) lauroyltransferase